MKNRLLPLLTTAAIIFSLTPLPALGAEAPLAPLPDEPAPIVIEKDVPQLEQPQQELPALSPAAAEPLSLDALELYVEDLGGIAMMSAESRDAAPSNSVLIASSDNGQPVAQMYATLNRQNNTASLVYVPKATGMVVVPRTFTHEEVEFTVTSVGHQAFAGLTDLTQVWLPDTVASIGAEAFMDCEQLKAVGTYDDQGNSDPYALPKSITDIAIRAFRGCTRLNSVTIPAAVERVDAWAFAYCYSLGRNYTDSTGVTYGVYFAPGSRLNSIHQGAFYSCISLENITLPQGLEYISLQAFYNCACQGSDGTLYGLKNLVIPSSVTEIGEQAFAYCGALKTLTIPASIQDLPAKTFYSCSALETVDFAGDGLKTMGDSVFYWCTKLKTIRTAGNNGLPATLASIPRWGFYRCDSLADLDLSGVTALRTIEPYAFNESGIVTLTLPQNLKHIGMLAFESCGKLKTIHWNRPEQDEDLLEVGDKAFAKTGVVQVTVPQLMEGNSNGLEMFYDCDSLVHVDTEPEARFIPDGAFRDCDSLTGVTLGGKIDTVGLQAFYSCPQLTDVNFDAGKLAVIKPLAFCRTSLPAVSLPATIQEIGLNAFGINRRLTSIEIAEGNPGGYYSADGVLYQSNQNNGGSVLLVKYPAGKAGAVFAVPDGVTAIESYAFSHSENLTQVTFPGTLRVIGYYALSHCINLRYADVPEQVAQGDEIFEGSYHMVQVTLPPDLKKLSSSSFPVNSKVTSVTLPASVNEIDVVPGPFSSLSLLREIKVDPANPNFKSVDGVLFSRDGTTLYAYPRGKAGSEYVVPDGVTTIWYSAFSDVSSLKHLTFPASVTTVRASACYNMSGLERLDILTTPVPNTNPDLPAYNNFLLGVSKDVQVYINGDPTDKAGAADLAYDFIRYCTSNGSIPNQNIHVDFFKPVTTAGDRFVENGVVYTLADFDRRTVTVGDNSHYEGSHVSIPAQVTHDDVTYTVTAVESGAFAAAALQSATVMLSGSQISAGAFSSAVTLEDRSALTSLTAGQTDLIYGDVLTVNTPAGVAEGTAVSLTSNGKSLSAPVLGGTALFPVDKAMVDAFGFGTTELSVSGGGASGKFTLTLSPKTYTVNDLPWYSSTRQELVIQRPYDGTSILDHTERKALSGFAVAGDDLALHVTGTVPAPMSNTIHSNADSDTEIHLEFTGSAAPYYRIDDGILRQVKVQVTDGQLYLKEVDGVLQQPTFRRVWAAEDGMRLVDCELGGGQFIAYLPQVENGVITGFTQVDVAGSISYDEKNPYPALSSFDEIGVQQDQSYKWVFTPANNGELQEVLKNYRFRGTVTPWDTNLSQAFDDPIGKVGENPPLPAYVLQLQNSEEIPARPSDSGGAAAPTPGSPSAPPADDNSTGSSGSSSSSSGSGSGGSSSSSGGSSNKPTASKDSVTTAPSETAPQETPVAPAAAPVAQLFQDIAPTDWYCDAVQYVYDRGMMKGMDESSFAPSATTTRGTIVTMLHRLEAEPAVSGPAFRDVSDQWYAAGVSWAASSGLVNGYGDGAFYPEEPITREQAVTILYRYAAMKGYDVSARADLGRFSDVEQISGYALEAISWANASGILLGQDWGGLNPAGTTTRVEMAAILMRFCENIMGR